LTRFAIQSFGCRVNQAEAFAWVSELQRRGMTFTEDVVASDIVLINTCTLTNRADRDVRAYIRRILRDNPRIRLVITGCYAERTWDKLFDHPRVWRVFPNERKGDLATAVAGRFGGRREDPGEEYRSRALVKIQDGCDLGCSFCVIPSVRGASRSVPLASLVEQVSEVVGRGYAEVVLTGVHICLYGRDMGLRDGLLELLKALEKIDGLWRVRLSSLDPRFLSDALINHMTGSSQICPHFHLSLQSGSDEVLRRMGRGNRRALYRRILERFSAGSPEAALGADIIVGFPGETEALFRETEIFLEESPLRYLHVFSFSPRSGTPASRWEGVDEKEKKERSAVLRNLSARRNLAFRKGFLGRELDGIVVKRDEAGCRVLTTNYIDVKIPVCSVPARAPVRIGINKVTLTGAEGAVIEECMPPPPEKRDSGSGQKPAPGKKSLS
jgi:threonylcarbamoyladenosine tRNA methylthiotransferase MtaB